MAELRVLLFLDRDGLLQRRAAPPDRPEEACLAAFPEALLRIPDTQVARALTGD